jgi:phosphoribosylglycinamide formyltransferase-1
MEKFSNHPDIRVALVVCNKPGAGVLAIAEQYNIPVLLIEKERFFRGDAYLPELQKAGIDFIALAGFLWKVPNALIQAFPQHIINIHPALLPNYGGKGMYGHHVHQAVVDNKEKHSGITIHLVDEKYDHGLPVLQATCPVLPDDTAYTLSRRVLALEHKHYPEVIERLLSRK